MQHIEMNIIVYKKTYGIRHYTVKMIDKYKCIILHRI